METLVSEKYFSEHTPQSTPYHRYRGTSRHHRTYPGTWATGESRGPRGCQSGDSWATWSEEISVTAWLDWRGGMYEQAQAVKNQNEAQEVGDVEAGLHQNVSPRKYSLRWRLCRCRHGEALKAPQSSTVFTYCILSVSDMLGLRNMFDQPLFFILHSTRTQQTK